MQEDFIRVKDRESYQCEPELAAGDPESSENFLRFDFDSD